MPLETEQIPAAAQERPIDLDAVVEASQAAQAPEPQPSPPEPVPEPAADEPPAEETEPTPIERPDNWPAEAQERWGKLDRDTQQWLRERAAAEQRQIEELASESTEERRALEQEAAKAERARQDHEKGLVEALSALEITQNRDFADIKTPADVAKLADEDPFRFAKWQAQQYQTQTLRAQAQQMYETRVAEQREQFEDWADTQDTIFSDTNKDFADPAKAADLRTKVVIPYVTEVLGVDASAIPTLWANPIIRDAKMQQAIYDAARFHAAQKAANAAVPDKVAAPQKPGPAAQRTGGNLASAADSGDIVRYLELRKKGHVR